MKCIIDIHEILELLPHRYPFLLIDRVIDMVPNKSVVAIKNVTMNEAFFVGHFRVVLYRVSLCKAMAQAGSVLLINHEHETK